MRFCYVLVMALMLMLTGCGYWGGSSSQPTMMATNTQHDWQRVMEKIPLPFGIHMPQSNIIIGRQGMDKQSQYMVLNHVMGLKLPSLEVWMPGQFGDIGYGANVRDVLKLYGYNLGREWYEDVKYVPSSEEGKRRPRMATGRMFKQSYMLTAMVPHGNTPGINQSIRSPITPSQRVSPVQMTSPTRVSIHRGVTR